MNKKSFIIIENLEKSCLVIRLAFIFPMCEFFLVINANFIFSNLKYILIYNKIFNTSNVIYIFQLIYS